MLEQTSSQRAYTNDHQHVRRHQNDNEVPLHTTRTAVTEYGEIRITSMWGNGDPCVLMVGMETVQPVWKIIWWFFKMRKRITIRPSNSSSSYIPKRIKNRSSNKYLYMAVYSSTHSQQLEVGHCKRALSSAWINDMWYTATTESFSAIKEMKYCYMLQRGWTLKTLC